MTQAKQQLDPPQIRDIVIASLEDDKGVDIVSIPLSGKSTMADYMIVASGQSSRQVAAMAQHIEMRLKEKGVGVLGKEGLEQADWVLLDTAEVIIHLFRPEVRDFYQLERMWDTSQADEIVTVSAEQS